MPSFRISPQILPICLYEIGAENGTLAMDLLDFIRNAYPEVYERTRYNIVEIGGRLAKLQEEPSIHGPRHDPCVSIAHKSIFHWDWREPVPCFFLTMEAMVRHPFPSLSFDPFISRRTILRAT